MDLTREEIIDFYQIDLTKLSRNFLEYPVKSRGQKVLNEVTFEDFQYLYGTLDMNYYNIAVFLSISAELCRNLLKQLGLNKTRKEWLEATIKTNMKKYGVSSPMKSEQIKEKLRNTFIEKFGTTSPLKNEQLKEKMKQNNLKKYGVSSPSKLDSVKQKQKETYIKKYGVSSPMKSEKIKEKWRQNNLKKYGVSNPTKSEKIKEKARNTCIEQYGGPSPACSKEITRKAVETSRRNHGGLYHSQTKEFQDNVKQICLERYGVDNWTKSEQYKEMWKNEEYKNHRNQKCYETQKQHNTFHTSKSEEEMYQLLSEKFPDVKRQYRDERYPFACDFYIPSKDLFIEYQGTWTHGGHPFDENNPEDLKIVEEWKRRSEELNFKGKKKNFYKMALYTWTDLDIRKRKYKNTLNWIEFFGKKDVEDFIESFS